MLEGLIEKNAGCIEPEYCSSPVNALKIISEKDFDLIVSGYSLDEMTGGELLKKIRESGKDVPFILMINLLREEKTIEPINVDVNYFMIKDTDVGEQIDQLNEIASGILTRKESPGKDEPEFNEAKYRSIIESMDDSIYMVDRECRYLFMNKKHLERLGKTSGFYNGSRYRDYHTNEESDNFSGRIEEVLSSGKTLLEEYEKCGKRFIRSFSPVKSINEKMIIAVNVVSKVIDAGRENDPGEDSIYIVDKDCRYLSINNRHMKRLGMNCEENFIGRSYEEFHPRGKNETFSRLIKEVFETGRIKRDEYESGDSHFIRRFCPVLDPRTGKVNAVTVISTNVTDQKITEKSLIEANKKLNLLNSITRHDILNQMTVLQGYLGMALQTSTDPELLNFLDKQKAAADTIYHQILFTRDYQNIGVRAPVWQNISGFVDRSAAGLNTGGVMIDNRCGDLRIFADPMLEKVFYNLMENSLRHGGDLTRISVYCEAIPHGIKLIYEDDGCGIVDEDKERIFKQGYGKNTGLGLFLIREILSITGLEIHETGVYGEGARFEITIPDRMFSEKAC